MTGPSATPGLPAAGFVLLLCCTTGARGLTAGVHLARWGRTVQKQPALGGRAGQGPDALLGVKPRGVGHGHGGFGGGSIVEGGAKGGAEMGRASATCGMPFPAPDRGSTVCPEECPFMRYDADKVCHWKCITKQDCLSSPNMPLGVINATSGICSVCAVAGCGQCAADANSCKVCKRSFDLVRGNCLPESRHFWHSVYAVIGLAAAAALVWAVVLPCRRVVNEEVCEHAITHRSYSKVRSDNGRHAMYPLWTNLCANFIPQGGTGILLHFRFEHAVLQWSVLVAFVMMSVAMWYSRMEASEILTLTPAHEEVFRKCQALTPGQEGDLEEMRVAFLIGTAIVYLFSTVGALAFAVSQRRTYVSLDMETSTMEDFGLFCDGFPREAWGAPHPEGSTIEDEITSFFRVTCGFGEDILGVSVVWDIAGDSKDEVERLLAVVSSRLEHDRNDRPDKAELWGRAPIGRGGASAARAVDGSRGGCSVWSRLGQCSLPDLEGKLLLGDSPLGGAHIGDKLQEEELEKLGALETTGSVFAVFRRRADLDRALSAPLPQFRGLHKISAEHLECDAGTVLWDGFTMTNRQRATTLVGGVAALILMIVVWALCFYAPWAYYMISWSRVAGASQGLALDGLIQNTMLGLLITIGNQAVYMTCFSVAESCRFKTRDSRDTVSVVLYTFAVSVNTIFDLAIVLLMAHGWQQDTGLDEEALIRNPSMQHALYIQMVQYIFPGTILLPFLLEPVVQAIVPYYLYKYLIRSRSDIDVLHAEELMTPPAFDLNRYGDIVVNMVLCSFVFFLTSVRIWWLFAQLVVSSIVICAWDHYKFLRETQRTMFASDTMDICGQYLTVIPCAVLAGALVFKAQGGQAMVDGWDRNQFFSVRLEWLVVLGAIAAHAVAHTMLLYFVVPRMVQSPQPETANYEDVAAEMSCTWFTANPVHCLRSLCHFGHEPPHVWDTPGRGHLHRANPSIHAYYEVPYFEPENSLLTDARELVAHELQKKRQSATNILAVLTGGDGPRASTDTGKQDGGQPRPRKASKSEADDKARSACSETWSPQTSPRRQEALPATSPRAGGGGAHEG